MKKKTSHYRTIGEMLAAQKKCQEPQLSPVVAAFRAAGAFRKPEGVVSKKSTKTNRR